MLALTFSRRLSSPGRNRVGGTHRARAWRVGLLAAGCSLALGAGDALAGQVPVSPGAAGSFAALAGSTVTSTGFTTLNGDLGVSPGSSLTGFPPGKVNGARHATPPTRPRPRRRPISRSRTTTPPGANRPKRCPPTSAVRRSPRACIRPEPRPRSG